MRGGEKINIKIIFMIKMEIQEVFLKKEASTKSLAKTRPSPLGQVKTSRAQSPKLIPRPSQVKPSPTTKNHQSAKSLAKTSAITIFGQVLNKTKAIFGQILIKTKAIFGQVLIRTKAITIIKSAQVLGKDIGHHLTLDQSF
ncbi:unnamed protein product [Cochlearia groenlandica]